MIRIELTPEKYAEKAGELQVQQDIRLQPYEGTPLDATANKDGISIGYTYDGEVLEATVLHHPFIEPETVIEDRLRAWLGVK